MLRGAPEHGLEGEQQRHDQEEPRRRALGWGQGDLARLAEAEPVPFPPVPAEEAPSPEGREEQACPAEERDEREHAPYHQLPVGWFRTSGSGGQLLVYE